ncbi:hypothetical protein ACFL3E_01855 [Patescibacteria group bacterium]
MAQKPERKPKIKNILIKVSGDTSNHRKVLAFIKRRAKTNFVVVICGGGSQVNKALREAGFTPNFDEHGRMAETWKERKIARDALEQEQNRLQNQLIGSGAYVEAPYLEAGPVLCPINGDNLVIA